jgi:hypothetical protein
MYQLRSTISDELYHTEDWVSIDGAKKALMESKVWNFAEELIKVDMEFPDFYSINGKTPKAHSDVNIKNFGLYALNNYYSKGGGKKLDEDFQAILKKFSIEIENKPLIQFGLFNSLSELLAVSDSEEKLNEFCQKEYGESATKFSVNCKYYIEPYDKIKLV